MTLLSALNTAARATNANSIGIQVAGNNIANASNPNYVREVVQFATVPPTRQGSLNIGNGAVAQEISRKVNSSLQERARIAQGDSASDSARAEALARAEGLMGELADNDLSTAFSEFFAALDDLQTQPSNLPTRSIAISKADSLAQKIRDTKSNLDGIRRDISTESASAADQVNQTIEKLRDLNVKIVAAEAGEASQAGALRTERANQLGKLTELVDVRVYEEADGEINVFSGNQFLLFNQEINRVVAKNETIDGVVETRLVLEKSQSELPTSGGRLGGLQSALKTDLRQANDQLNQLAGDLIESFNRIHSTSASLQPTQLVRSDSILDTTAALNTSAAGLDFVPNDGSFDLAISVGGTGLPTRRQIDVDLDGTGTDDSLTTLASKINTAFGSTIATVTLDRRLQLTAPSGGSLQIGNDTTGLFGALGMSTFFSGSKASDIAVRQDVLDDPKLLAVSNPNSPNNSEMLASYRRLLDQPNARTGRPSLANQITGLVGDLGSASQTARVDADASQGVAEFLSNEHLSVAGVNIDEEVLKLLEYQRGFQAATRVISTVNELMDEVMQIGR